MEFLGFALFFISELLDGEPKSPFLSAYMDDLGRDFLPFLEAFGRGLALLARKFRNMHQAFNAFFNFHEQAKIGDVCNDPLDGAAHRVSGCQG